MAGRLAIAGTVAVYFGVGGYLAFLASRLHLVKAGFAGSYSYNLLVHSAPWALLAAAALGVLLGASVERRKRDEIRDGKVLRHDTVAFLEHWTHALSTLLLLLSGVYLGFLFLPRLVHDAAAVGFVMNLHYLGALMFLFGTFHFLTVSLLEGGFRDHLPQPGDLRAAILHYTAKLGVGEAPPEGKYLASERLAFVGWVIGVGGILATGTVKVAAHIWSLPAALMGVVTFVHDVFALGMLFMLAAHVVASSVLPWSWPLFRSMLTGYVPLEYARHHHPKWVAELQEGSRDQERPARKRDAATNSIAPAAR